jgi:hypothetical protein
MRLHCWMLDYSRQMLEPLSGRLAGQLIKKSFGMRRGTSPALRKRSQPFSIFCSYLFFLIDKNYILLHVLISA